MRRPMLCALLLVLAACGQAGDPVPGAQPAPPTTPSPPPPEPGTPLTEVPREPPPPLRVRGGGKETVLSVWSSCWQSGNVGT
ncbi:MAG TPA: hypothetical protein VGV86_16145, partial [Acidimicrobiales bacterium]|nr:hypothetical protein [Acidimicrobiales bacterium]